MKRNSLLLLGSVIFFSVFSWVILAVLFDKNFCSCIESLMEAIFTGSVIAIPGYIFLLYEEKKDNTNELNNILFTTLVIMQDCFYNNPQKFIGDQVEQKRTKIVAQYKSLIKIKTNNVFLNKEQLDSICDSIFNFSKKIVELNQKVSSNSIAMDSLEFENDFETINSIAQKCIDDIKAEIELL